MRPGPRGGEAFSRVQLIARNQLAAPHPQAGAEGRGAHPTPGTWSWARRPPRQLARVWVRGGGRPGRGGALTPAYADEHPLAQPVGGVGEHNGCVQVAALSEHPEEVGHVEVVVGGCHQPAPALPPPAEMTLRRGRGVAAAATPPPRGLGPPLSRMHPPPHHQGTVPVLLGLKACARPAFHQGRPIQTLPLTLGLPLQDAPRCSGGPRGSW